MYLANGSGLGGIVSRGKDWGIIQDKLDDLTCWSERNGMQFISAEMEEYTRGRPGRQVKM